MEKQAVSHGNVYEESFAGIDIGAKMRGGHVDVAEGDAIILDLVDARLARLKRTATIVDVGSGSGVLSELLASRFPDHQVIANDVAQSNIDHARARLSRFANAQVSACPFEHWSSPVDILISWGTHHHLPHGYLARARELLRPGGCLLIGDEFCPEYLTSAELARGKAWLVDGYLFTSPEEEQEYRRTTKVPVTVQAREEARRNALWPWYRFVIDEAIIRGDWEVACLELQIARDDLTTSFADEHKTSPMLLETELRAEGFTIVSKRVLGERPQELQSFVIYEAEVIS